MSEHFLRVGRVQIGRSPIGRGSPLYGTSGSCSCGEWRHKVNTAPSKGGRRDIEREHRRHLELDDS